MASKKSLKKAQREKNLRKSQNVQKSQNRKKNWHRQEASWFCTIAALILIIAGGVGATIGGLERMGVFADAAEEFQPPPSEQAPESSPVLWPNLPDPAELSSRSAILVRLADGAVAFEKDPDYVLYPASLTKMMTVLVALEHLEDLTATVIMPTEIYEPLRQQSAAMAGFLPGEAVQLRDVLYGAMLPSGAECCEVLALTVAGSSQAFVDLMNQKAQELGMNGTHFTNTTGLHDDMQYSGARDMAVLLRYALENPEFREIFTTYHYQTSATNYHPQGLSFVSNLARGLSDPDFGTGRVLGGKTGYTDESGLSLASLAAVGDEEYILITMGAPDDLENPGYISDALLVYEGLV